MTNTIEVVRTKISSAATFAEVFGTLPPGSPEDQARALKRQYRYLAKLVHPDQATPAQRALATVVFDELSKFYASAEHAFEHGLYDRPLGSGTRSTETVTLSAGSRVYTIAAEPVTTGDFSNIHFGKDEQGNGIVAKVARDPTYNQYLVHEAMFLKRVGEQPSQKSLIGLVPGYLDSLILTEPGNEQFRVTIYRQTLGQVSLTQVRERHQSGLAPEDAMWIARRVIAQTLAATMMNVVHGAIVPDHVLIHPLRREPLHIGWAHAVLEPDKHGRRITMVIDRWRDWYPKEVFARTVPNHQTDLYMAGKTILYLLGGDVVRNRFPNHIPPDVAQLIGRLLEENPAQRPRDGLTFMRELTTAAHRHWGKTYRPLPV